MLLENQQKNSDEENHKQIEIEDILKSNESGQSPTVVIDGPPGIGKTTLCRKLLNLWANGELKHQQNGTVLSYQRYHSGNTILENLIKPYLLIITNAIKEVIASFEEEQKEFHLKLSTFTKESM